MRLCLYQPDIPQNVGTMLRLCACLSVPTDIIEPCGFVFSDKKLLRAGMDYLDLADVHRHTNFETYKNGLSLQNRLILLTTKGAEEYTDFRFLEKDVLVVGRESCGVPDDVHQAAFARVVIPMRKEARSLNVALSAAIVLSEALRQTRTRLPSGG